MRFLNQNSLPFWNYFGFVPLFGCLIGLVVLVVFRLPQGGFDMGGGISILLSNLQLSLIGIRLITIISSIVISNIIIRLKRKISKQNN